MGSGPAEGASDHPGLKGPGPSLYLLAYDGEDAACRRLVDWVQKRDTGGLVVSFPFQNPELVHVAPELAGLPQIGAVLGLDTRTRAIHEGAGALSGLLLRLPRWRALAPLAAVPALASMIFAFMRRRR